MTFAFPVALAALALVPLLLLAYLLVQRRRSRYALRFTNLPLLANVVDATPRWRRHVPALLALASLTALIVGLARPQIAVAVPRKEGTVILAIDRSGSMLATDVTPSRMAAARAAAATFIKGPSQGLQGRARLVLRPGRRRPPADLRPRRRCQGAQSPSGRQRHSHRGRDHSLRRSRSRRVSTQKSPAKGTPPRRPAPLGRRQHDRRPDAARGRRGRQEQEGSRLHGRTRHRPRARSRSPRADGQERLYRVPPDPATLSAVAETTGGKFFEAADAKSLQSVYSRIGSQVGTQVEEHEVTAVLTGAGAVLLLAGSALSLAWFNRLP